MLAKRRIIKIKQVHDISGLWGIDAGELLEEIKNEFELTQKFNIGNIMDDL